MEKITGTLVGKRNTFSSEENNNTKYKLEERQNIQVDSNLEVGD